VGELFTMDMPWW